MKRDGTDFISGSEAPRRFTELLADRPPLPLEDPDEVPAPIALEPPRQLRANKGDAA